MAIKLELDNGDLRGRVDVTRYVASPAQQPMVLRERMNQPSLLDFVLLPADGDFTAPRRSAYVRLTGLADALPPGGPRVPGALFTGYITSEPQVDFLGVRNGAPVHGFRCRATSEEILLNVKRIGLLPPFLSQTAGEILRRLTEHLQPGRFDTAGIADGPVVPLYRVAPDALWSDVARALAERSGFAYCVLDGKIFFVPVDAAPAGLAMDEHDLHFRPDALDVSSPGNPVQNDVTIFGDVEPQAAVTEYFAGDGFTSRFPLSLPVYGAESALLLADDFTGAAIDASRWEKVDPGGALVMFEGRLNVTGGTGALGETFLRAQQAIELGGELECVHGEFEFVAPSRALLGGLYTALPLDAANCLFAFDVSPIAASTRIRALIGGSVQAAEVIAQAGHTYVLITRLSADQPHRIEQTFSALGVSYGGGVIPAHVRVTLLVRDFDASTQAPPVETVLHDATLSVTAPFAFYAPINAAELHAAVNFLQLARPIQAQLITELPGQPPRVRALGFGIAGQDATITSDPLANQWALEFYEDTIPARGEKISLRYRAAGRARARVRDAASISAEAELAGDDGVRAAVLASASPQPRTSREAELAAQAWLADHAAPRLEGRYATWSDFTDAWPRAGRLLAVHNASRYPAFTALVREVTSEFRELATERVLHTVEFGQPARFEELLQHFLPREGVFDAREDIPLEPVDVAEIAAQFLSDAPPEVTLAVVFGTAYTFDAGAPPPANGHYEVRRSDAGWSRPGTAGTTQNLLGAFAAQSFSLPRTARHQIFFVRPVDAAGVTSRFSAAVAVHYPLPPAQPASLGIAFAADAQGVPVIRAVVLLEETQIADVNRVELRDEDNATVLATWEFGQLRHEGAQYVAELTIDNSTTLARSKTLFAYTQNALGEYSAARMATASQPQPLKPSLTPGNSVGQILEVLLDRVAGEILETQIQVAAPDGSFAAPAQDVRLPGQPDKFNFVATQAGAWSFRARRRDALGWSPWSSEPQGQIPAETLVFAVQFFQAGELDPSVGAAINAQNLLPNSEFFLAGLAGQEGASAPRYFALTNAAADGSEVTHLAASNEVQWKSSVNFAQSNPGVRSLLTNLGRLFNPGEPVTFSAALRHDGTGAFARAVRFALRSASDAGYEQTGDIAVGLVTPEYQWFSVTFTLPDDKAVPADLAFVVEVAMPAGQSLASSLYCDKVILNRGHRPAAFALSPWDVQALVWNAAAGAYDLPATAVAAVARDSDPGFAGRLAGTGTDDLDPDFTSRFHRVTV
jgi:hypothetical protein